MFLLDLASTSGGRSTGDEQSSTSGPWAVGEFKCLDNLEAPVACKQLLQSKTCNDALLQHLHNCDSAGVRIYSSQPMVNSVLFFQICILYTSLSFQNLSPGKDMVDGIVMRSFHRSVSMDIEKSPLRRPEMINRRKRINSTIDPGMYFFIIVEQNG